MQISSINCRIGRRPFRAIDLLHGERDLRINLIVVFQAVDKEPFDQANLLL